MLSSTLNDHVDAFEHPIGGKYEFGVKLYTLPLISLNCGQKLSALKSQEAQMTVCLVNPDQMLFFSSFKIHNCWQFQTHTEVKYSVCTVFRVQCCTLYIMLQKICTALRNRNQIVYQDMSSWTSLKWNIGTKTAFLTNHIKSIYVLIFIMMIHNFHNIMYTKMHTNIIVALKANFMSSQLQSVVFPLICIFFNHCSSFKLS